MYVYIYIYAWLKFTVASSITRSRPRTGRRTLDLLRQTADGQQVCRPHAVEKGLGAAWRVASAPSLEDAAARTPVHLYAGTLTHWVYGGVWR